MSKTIILGIETSCDETAVALVEENGSNSPKILSNIISSQVNIHKEFGGVVPELAARSHVEKIDLIAKKNNEESGISLQNISCSCYFWSRSSSLFISWIKFW